MPYKTRAEQLAFERRPESRKAKAERRYKQRHDPATREMVLAKERARKDQRREYEQRPDVKARRIALRKARNATPEGRQKNLAKSKRYHERHPEKRAEYQRLPHVVAKTKKAGEKWRKSERGQEMLRQYRGTLKYKMLVRVCHEMRRDAPGAFTPDDVKYCLTLQGWRCFYCLASLLDGYHVDHMRPLSRGGTHDPENIVCACARCNLKNTQKHPLSSSLV